MECLSTYLNLLFLSTVFCNFQYISCTSFVIIYSFKFYSFWFYYTLKVFLNFISDYSLLSYKSSTDFCFVNLYSTTLLNLLISSSTFLLGSLGFLVYKMISWTNRDSFIFFQPDAFYFIFLTDCLAWIPSTLLNKNGKSGHHCLSCSWP